MRLLFLCCVIGTIVQVNAQNSSSRVFHSDNGRAYKIVGLDGNFYFCAVRYTPSYTDPTDIVSVDRNGTERFRLNVSKREITTVSDLVVTANKQLLAVVYGSGCDTGPAPGRFLIRFDTSGNKIFDVAFDQFGYPTNGAGTFIAESPNGDIYIGSDTLLYRFSAAGAMLAKKDLGFGNITAISAVSHTGLIVCANSGGMHTYLIDTMGSIHGFIPSGTVKRFMQSSTGRILAFTSSGQVEKFSGGLTSKTVYKLAAGTIDAVMNADTIYSITGFHAYQVYDTSLSVLHNFSLAIAQRSVAGLALTNGEVGFLSNGGSFSIAPYEKLQNGTHPAFTRFRSNAGFTYDHDVGVTGLECDSCVATYPYYLRLRVRVKNFGSTPVHRFRLNSPYYNDHFICGTENYRQEFNVPPIDPGDSVEVTTKGYYGYFPFVPTGGDSGLAYYARLFTTAPNLEVDKAPLNDAKYFSVAGLAEQTVEIVLSCYPNPAQEQLNWQADAAVGSIIVSAVDGKIIRSFIVNDVTGQVDIHDLAGGFYIVRFVGSSGTAVRKFIKD
jgi:hypothetical protein